MSSTTEGRTRALQVRLKRKQGFAGEGHQGDRKQYVLSRKVPAQPGQISQTASGPRKCKDPAVRSTEQLEDQMWLVLLRLEL